VNFAAVYNRPVSKTLEYQLLFITEDLRNEEENKNVLKTVIFYL